MRLVECSEPGDELAAWFADALARYEAGAPHGARLEQALGLDLSPGEPPWWLTERRERRDAAIRQLAREFFPGLPIRGAARALRARRDLMRRLPEPVSESTIRRALAGSNGLPSAEPGPRRSSRP